MTIIEAEHDLDGVVAEAVRGLMAGDYKLSSLCKPVVAAIRVMAHDWGWSSLDTAKKLGSTSRNIIISIAHRSTPLIQFRPKVKTNQHGRPYPYNHPGTPRKPRNTGDTLSTHYQRLADTIEDRRKRQSVLSNLEDAKQNLGVPVPDVDPTTAAFIRGRMLRQCQRKILGAAPQRCSWFNCEATIVGSRGYCADHLREAGYVVTASPLKFEDA